MSLPALDGGLEPDVGQGLASRMQQLAVLRLELATQRVVGLLFETLPDVWAHSQQGPPVVPLLYRASGLITA